MKPTPEHFIYCHIGVLMSKGSVWLWRFKMKCIIKNCSFTVLVMKEVVWSTNRGLNSKTPWKRKWKPDKMVNALLTFYCSNSKLYSVVCMAHACLYAFLINVLMRQWKVSWGIASHFWTELLDSLTLQHRRNHPRGVVLDLGQESVVA